MRQTLDFNEEVMYRLRSLYGQYGYSQYKMGKFEEYDFYARNKDFLICDSVITFTDTNGKLMALKPDVTLSIVKNTVDDTDGVQKLYYNENVYRVAKGSGTFREIQQAGLECLGAIDDYCISEVLLLAAESLRSISSSSVLILSHMGILSEAMQSLGIPADRRNAVLKCFREKNQHELCQICGECGVSQENIETLKQLVSTGGTPDTVFPRLQQLLGESVALEQLRRILEGMKGSNVQKMLRFDFSVVNDSHYYNGIVFKGYIQGIPDSVLSGGQYDKLMRKLNRRAGAIGFAVYMDLLERMGQGAEPFDVDVLLLYDPGTAPETVHMAVRKRMEDGSRVMAQPRRPHNIRCKRLLQLSGGEVKTVENHA